MPSPLTMDPHTEFFPPVDKRYFDEEMSGRFLVSAPRCNMMKAISKWARILAEALHLNQVRLQPGDIIHKVAQGNEEPVDLTGFVVTDAVKLIRGKKGTEVRLTVKKQDGTIKVISLDPRSRSYRMKHLPAVPLWRMVTQRLDISSFPNSMLILIIPMETSSFIDVAKGSK